MRVLLILLFPLFAYPYGDVLRMSQGGTGNSTFTSGGMCFSNGTQLTTDASNIFWDNVNKTLAIGTSSSPANVKLNVVGNRSQFAANSETYAIGVKYNSSAGPFYIGASNSATPDIIFSNSGGGEKMRIEYSGNVGIGTSPSAGYLLHLLKNGDTRLLVQTSGVGNVAEQAFGNPSISHRIGIETTTDSGGGGFLGAANSLNISVAGANSLSVDTNGTQRLLVDSTGKTGTTSSLAPNYNSGGCNFSTSSVPFWVTDVNDRLEFYSPSTNIMGIQARMDCVATTTTLALNPAGGSVNIANLAGTGSRVVAADASGNLSATAAMPVGGEYTPSYTAGCTGGFTPIQKYQRVGNVVSYVIQMFVPASTFCHFSLPVASDIQNANDCQGRAFGSQNYSVTGDTATNDCYVSAFLGGSETMTIMGSYIIR